jgi:hypothetical protein
MIQFYLYMNCTISESVYLDLFHVSSGFYRPDMDWSLTMRSTLRSGQAHSAADGRTLVELPDGTTWSAPAKAGMTLCCLRGTIWLTQTRMPDDILMTPGKTFTAIHRGKLVVVAMSDAVMEIRPA